MIRLIGFVLGTISSITLISTFSMMVYQVFIGSNEDLDGEELGWLMVSCVISMLIFIYVFRTGFGRTRLERAKEELEVLKIKQDIGKLRNS